MSNSDEKYARRVGLRAEQFYTMIDATIQPKWYEFWRKPIVMSERVDTAYDLLTWNGSEWLKVPVKDIYVIGN